MTAPARASPRRSTALVLLLAGLALATAGRAAAAAAAAADGGAIAPERLIFLLEYVGSDYDNAVRDGAVVSQLEYGELLRFARELIRGYDARRGRSDAILAGLRELEQLIVRRAPGDEVWATTRRLSPLLSESVGGGARPATQPDLANGRRLWASDCAPCHGGTGNGDGRAAAGMEPPPTAFRGRYLDRLSPRQVYNAVKLGVDGTAMPSFDAYTEEQRWDVAFHVMTLRVGFAPKRPRTAVDLAVADLALRSNADLLDVLRQRNAGATPEEVDHLRVSFPAARGVSLSGAGATAASGGIAVALQLQEVFAAIAERVSPRVVGVSGYQRDPDWTPERLQSERGDAWMSANEDELRYPGFRRVRSASGFLVDDQGFVLSVDHLIRDQRGELLPLVDVELADETHLPAAVVGAEPTLDLAVLRVADRSRLSGVGPDLELGDSDRLEVGHWLVALGDPHGPEKTFAVGVVAAPPARQCYQEHLSATLLQSSLVVPATGLGGPVVDIFGRVVGIGVRPGTRFAGREGSPALGALPINLVLNLFEALKVAESVRSPWIGVSVLELPLLQRRLERESKTAVTLPPAGVYVDDVFDPSPAAQAGVRPGDFLLGLGGHQIRSVADFQTWLYVLGSGSKVDLELLRDGKPLRLSAAIEVRPQSAMPR